MSKFAVEILKVRSVEPIPGADAVELAVVGDYRSVVKKGEFQAGDLTVYIPEGGVVTEELLEVLKLQGKLSGSRKNRVKAIKLRGCLSQGICFSPYREGRQWLGYQDFTEGMDVTEAFGITKWEPVIPPTMSGNLFNAGLSLTVNFDVENVKRYPDALEEGEDVTYTEKLHGTFCCVGWIPPTYRPEPNRLIHGEFILHTKNLGREGLSFEPGEQTDRNVYFRALSENRVFGALKKYAEDNQLDEPIYLLGEVFGPGVQDLSYGKDLSFRVFYITKGLRQVKEYLDYDDMVIACASMGVPRVPVLYRGPHNVELMKQYTSGLETISGEGLHIREGIVITPTRERRDPRFGRVCLKSVSEEYLLRKGAEVTEYN